LSIEIDKVLRDTLLKLATGYEYEEREVIAGKNGKPEKVKVTKRYQKPDFRAIQEIQTLRELGLWTDE